MPGPKKAQAQRVKGNLKPSSSSQAAQLLAASGQSPLGFIGFSTQPAFVPASETFDDVDNSLDADFRLVLRKLSKKDTVTKIKALQELVSLCGEKSDEDIKAIVPFWPRIYNKVALDVDHKVRELSQRAMRVLANRAGKNMAPHLKSVMGAWIVSMCDTYPTVATAANSAFTGTFPAAKQVDAMRFCKEDIAECLLNNIMKHTAQTLSDPTTTSEEDMTAKYNRVVSSSLQAFCKLCTILPQDTLPSSLSAHFTSLLSNPNFWKHTKSSVATVKGGILNLLSCICQHCPEVSSQFVKKISPFVFAGIDTSDPVIISHVWEALLSLINAHEDCWDHVNWQKAVWPKFKRLLEGGCLGLAVIIGPCLLPFISRLPQRNFAPVFDAMRVGLTKDCLVNSLSEMAAFVQAFVECVQYAIKQLQDPESTNISNLLQDQVLVVVEAALTEEKPTLSKSPLFALLAPLVVFAEMTHPDVEEAFWKELSSFILSQLLANHQNVLTESETEKTGKSQNSLLHRLVLLIEGVVFQEIVSVGKEKSVRFSQHALKSHASSSSGMKRQPLSQAPESLIADLLVVSFYLADEHASSQFLSLFKDISAIHVPISAGIRLISDSDTVKSKISEDFTQKTEVKRDPEVESVLSLVYEHGNQEAKEETKHLRDFLYSKLLRLLLYHQKEDILDFTYTEELLMCMFSFLTYLPEEDGSKFLSTTLQVLTTHLITCQFIEQLLQQVNQVPACRNAVESLGIIAKIDGLAMEVTENLGKISEMKEAKNKTEPVWKMLSSLMSYLNTEENVPLPPACVNSIMGCCVSSLKWLHNALSVTGSEPVPSLIDLVLSVLEKKDVIFHEQFTDLLLCILSLVLSSDICAETQEDLESIWSQCLKLISSQLASTSYMSEVCNFIRNWVYTHLHSVEDLGRVSKVVQLMASDKTAEDETLSSVEVDDRKSSEVLESDGTNELELSHDITLDIMALDSTQVDEMEEVTKHLYFDGCLSLADSDSKFSTSPHVQSLQSYVLTAVHNLRTACIGRKKEGAQERRPHTFPRQCLECFATLAENILVIDTLQKTQKGALVNMEPIILELKNSALYQLASLTHQQMVTLVDITFKRSLSPLVKIGLEKLLAKLLHSDFELHSRRATSNGLRTLKTSFLHRFIIPATSAEEVARLLKDNSVLTDNDLSEAFSLTCSLLMSSDTCDLTLISGCLAGFRSLLADKPELSHELKSVIFCQTVGMVNHLKDKGFHLLTGSDISLVGDVKQLDYNVCVARIISAAIWYQNHDYWEFALCTLVEWLQFLSEVNLSDKSDKALQALLAAVCQMAYLAAHTFSKASVVANITSDTSSFAVTEKMKTEWDEFFAEGIFSSLLPLYASLASQCMTGSHSDTWPSVLMPLASAASLCPANLVLDHQLPARLSLTDSSALPDNLKTLLNHLCPLLNAKERHIGVAAFQILSCVVNCLPEYESKAVGSGKDGEEEEARMPPEAIVLVVESNAVYMDSLMTVDIEAEVEVEEGTDEYAQAMGYLLAWRLLLQLFKCSPNELRAKYAQFFKKQETVGHLLDHLFRLMPSNPSQSLLENNTSLKADDESKSQELFQVALSVYRQCLEVIPALVRTWWVDQNRKTANFVNRFTTDFMSNSLCWQQLTSPHMVNSDIEDVTIRARPAAREVCAMYQMAEVTINMTITLPKNYPLGKVDVVCDKRVGVSQAQWDRWLLQLNIFLQQQNGSIVEGLRVWKGNIDKKFEGIDDCMICFSVIHGTNFQLPRLTCRTCRKKFHSSCLYKWFHTSQKSSCPLCRNLF